MTILHKNRYDVKAITEDFLNRLHRGGTGAYYWTLPQQETRWFEAGKPAPVPNGPTQDVYFGVHPAVGIPDRNSRSKRSTTDTIAAVNALFADMDGEDFGSKEAAREHVGTLSPPPSVVIDSGGGFHCYWFLDDTFRIQRPEDREYISRLQAAWVGYVGGDDGAKDLARILRVPGTINYKYDGGRPVQFVEASFDRTYSLSHLESLLRQRGMLQEAKRQQLASQPPVTVEADSAEVKKARLALKALDDLRCDDYDAWCTVGMALHRDLGDAGLALWHEWSANSTKYDMNAVDAKWRTFSRDGNATGAVSMGTVYQWADEDSPDWRSEKAVPDTLTPLMRNTDVTEEEYVQVLQQIGYNFRQNACNDKVEVNGSPITDGLAAVLRMDMRNLGYNRVGIMEDAYTAHAYRNQYHPIKEYLEGLQWDGTEAIAKLASYFEDKHDTVMQDGEERTWFHVLLRRWLVGAVAKVYGHQNLMLVLDGPQGIGKSYFARWLGSATPLYFVEGPINPDDKDSRIRMMENWIWEVGELGSVTRRSDREALKAFITEQRIKVRKPYARHDTEKPAMASLIGTINNEGGFLFDKTGSRRFLVATLTKIDWRYTDEVDIDQVWAQAYHLFRTETRYWRLTSEEREVQARLNREEYEPEDIIETTLREDYVLDADNTEAFTTTRELRKYLEEHIRGHTSHSLNMQLSNTMQRLGLESTRQYVDGTQKRGYVGVESKYSIPV